MADRAAPTIAGIRVWQPLRGPAQRWPLATDLFIALMSFALTLLIWGSGPVDIDTLVDVGTFVVAFAGNFALLWRRSHPLLTHYVVLAASAVVLMGSMQSGIFALGFSLYSVGRNAPDSRASLIAMLVALLYGGVDYVLFGSGDLGAVVALGMMAGIWYVGRRLRFRAEYLRLLEERAEHLDRERIAEAERAVAAERTRIAREMHDIVAHQVSLMTVQAGAARTVSQTDPAAAREAMVAVEKAGRQAVSEMRGLLDVLRPVAHAHGDALGPQPGIGDLPALVEEVNDVGPMVHLHLEEAALTLPTRLQLDVYRIVQEALTNVIRHAGAGVRVEVSVKVVGGRLLVGVVDDGLGASVSRGGSGHGLVGMRERVELMGGEFYSASPAAGGFEVRADLPVRAEEP